MSTFAIANSCLADFARGRSGCKKWALHFEMRRWRFVFGSSKLPQIELVVENNAEVDAAGRYIPFPLVCRWLTMPSRTPLGAYYIYQQRGYHSVCLQLRLWKASNCKTGRSQIPRFSFVVKDNRNLSELGYLSDNKDQSVKERCYLIQLLSYCSFQ